MIEYNALIATVMLLLVGKGHGLDPCKKMTCPDSQFCVSYVPNCGQPPCARIGSCVTSVSPATCPPLFCSKTCPVNQILKYDNAGCETCHCYDPCEGVRCPINQECVTRANDSCIRAVCVDRLICQGWTEPHYRTYDGAGIDFQGLGYYVMSQFSNQNILCRHLRDFQVLVEQERRYPDKYNSYIRSVMLVLPGIVVLNIGQGLQVTVISGAIPSGMTFTTLLMQVPVWPRKPIKVLRIQTDFGLVVQFDGNMWASVMIPFSYRDCVEGLCGDADGNQWNDYITKQGVNVGSLPPNKRFWAIGNSWRVIDDVQQEKAEAPQVRLSLDDGQEAQFEQSSVATRFEIAPLTGNEQTVDKVDLSCDDEIMKIVDSDAYCGYLKNAAGPFADCISKMPRVAKSVYEGCKYDVCANKNNLEFAKSLAESSVATFVAICAGNGLLTEQKVVSESRGPDFLKSQL